MAQCLFAPGQGHGVDVQVGFTGGEQAAGAQFAEARTAANPSAVVWSSIVAMALAQALVTYLPALQRIFGTVALPAADIGLILATGVGFWLILTVERVLREGWR